MLFLSRILPLTRLFLLPTLCISLAIHKTKNQISRDSMTILLIVKVFSCYWLFLGFLRSQELYVSFIHGQEIGKNPFYLVNKKASPLEWVSPFLRSGQLSLDSVSNQAQYLPTRRRLHAVHWRNWDARRQLL